MEDYILSAKNSGFKTCAVCRQTWNDRAEFLADPDLEIIGYQVHFKDLKKGLFMFNHSCNTSLAIHAEKFTDLYRGEMVKERKTGTEECPGYCLHQDELQPCPARCECAYVRDIIQIIRNWPKRD